jgi:hypothetical protein
VSTTGLDEITDESDSDENSGNFDEYLTDQNPDAESADSE